MIVYRAKSRGRAEVGLAIRVVKALCYGMESFGHHLYTDNFYTSADLYQYFFENNIYVYGTIKGSRKNFPKDIVFEGARSLARGTYQCRMCGPLLAVAWLDNKVGYFLFLPFTPLNFHGRQMLRQELFGEEGQEREEKVEMSLAHPC